ncbi:MAG: ABC transporter ATP-binding protein [Clostridiales bacterium]|nr:ABC transporter ATP-binding protein [Clostridiales bacterium]
MLEKIKEKLIQISNKELFRTLYSYSKGYRLKIIYITILSAINSLTTIGIALLTKSIIDSAISKDLSSTYTLGSIVVIGLIFKLILSKYTMVYSTKIGETMFNDLQHRTIKTFYNNQWLFMSQFKTGDLITRSGNDVSKITGILMSTFPTIVSLLAQLITAFIILSSYDKTIAFIAFILGPATVSISWVLGHKLKELQAVIQESISELNSYITESIQNMDLIQSFDIKEEALDKLEKLQDRKRTLIYKKAIFTAITKGIIDFGFTIGFLGATLLGAYKLYQGVISFGTFTAFSQLVTHIQSPIYGLSKTIPSIITVLSSVERVIVFNENSTETPDTSLELQPNELMSLQFDNVSFYYEKDKIILDKLDLSINVGDKIALIGTSGEGKTTILRLVMALLEPSSGEVKLNCMSGSVPITSETRKYFSYVPQKNSLFSGSIIDNLLLANKNASKEIIEKALKSACIYDFIISLPNGVNTLVGERLGGLSEGQAQRICIARALVHNTPFLILDEATSALDTETEKCIINNISKNYTSKSLVVVTHKTEILNYCNHIYKLDNKKTTKVR